MPVSGRPVRRSARGSRSRRGGEAVLDRPGAGLADALDLDEVGHAGAHDLLQVREALDHVVGDDARAAAGSCGAAGSRAAAPRSRAGVRRQVQHAGDRAQVEEVFVVELGELGHHVEQLAVVARRRK